MVKIYEPYVPFIQRPFEPGWLVRTKEGREFSTHMDEDRDRADASAARIGGTVERFTPVTSTYWATGESRYDH